MSGATSALREAELTAEEVEQILKVCGPRALLVGGQSLATWAGYYGIQPIGELSRTVTMDADFIGTSETAQQLQRSLGQPWKLRKGTLDDLGPQIAKVYATLPWPRVLARLESKRKRFAALKTSRDSRRPRSRKRSS